MPTPVPTAAPASTPAQRAPFRCNRRPHGGAAKLFALDADGGISYLGASVSLFEVPAMRIVIGFTLFFGLCSATIGAEQFPYVTSIAAPVVDVRSGPGLDFYETSVLRRGDKVEIYNESADWLAIRPPLGSFSWVSGRYVDLSVGNIGTVTVKGLAARIGSENTELCETVQVKLKKGEKLLVLDRKETPENDASPLWYKISPPSGEYRWIPRTAVTSSVSKQQPPLIVPVRYEEENKAPEPIAPPPPLRTARKSESRQPEYRLNDENKNAVKRTPTVEDLGMPGEIPPLAELLANANPKRKQELPTTAAEKEPDPFRKAFEELKEEARAALIRPTEDWVFETLIKQGNYLYDNAPTDADLEKLYHLVEALQRTRAVRQEIAMKRQFRAGSPVTIPTPPSAFGQPTYGSNLAAAARTPVLVTTADQRTETPSYDIVGKLGEFEQRPVGYPPYGLADEKGEVICLITPSLGVDLDSRIGQKVGINGVLGVYQKPNEPEKRHITAQSVTEIVR